MKTGQKKCGGEGSGGREHFLLVHLLHILFFPIQEVERGEAAAEAREQADVDALCQYLQPEASASISLVSGPALAV